MASNKKWKISIKTKDDMEGRVEAPIEKYLLSSGTKKRGAGAATPKIDPKGKSAAIALTPLVPMMDRGEKARGKAVKPVEKPVVKPVEKAKKTVEKPKKPKKPVDVVKPVLSLEDVIRAAAREAMAEIEKERDCLMENIWDAIEPSFRDRETFEKSFREHYKEGIDYAIDTWAATGELTKAIVGDLARTPKKKKARNA